MVADRGSRVQSRGRGSNVAMLCLTFVKYKSSRFFYRQTGIAFRARVGLF